MICRYKGDVSDLGLTFSVDDTSLGKTVTVPLIDDGEDINVTNANRSLYLHLLTDWHLIKRPARASAAFARGMNKVRLLQSALSLDYYFYYASTQ